MKSAMMTVQQRTISKSTFLKTSTISGTYVPHVAAFPRNRPSLQLLTPFSTQLPRRALSVLKRGRCATVAVQARQGGGGSPESPPGTEKNGPLVILPAIAGVGVLLVASTVLGGGAAVFVGLPLVVAVAAGALGILTPLAAVLGVDALTAGGLVALLTFGVLLIPAFLKVVFPLIAVLALGSLINGIFNPKEEPEIDARNAVIDVQAETIDVEVD